MLQTVELSRTYGEVKALDQVSMTLTDGIYGLLGPNGAGKTTLIRILATLLKQTSGEATWNGQDIFQLGERYRDLLGYMPQQQDLYRSLTVYQFVDYFATLKQIPEKGRSRYLHHVLERLNILDVKNFRLGQLSGGMRQRVLIAQALLNNPKLLILDEPTAGLDPAERANLRTIIAELAEERIIIIATHVVSDIEFIAKEVILMKKGQILAKKNQAALLSMTPVYISERPLQTLRERFTDFKLVNVFPGERTPIHRFITHEACDCQKAMVMLDDVYLDWLAD